MLKSLLFIAALTTFNAMPVRNATALNDGVAYYDNYAGNSLITLSSENTINNGFNVNYTFNPLTTNYVDYIYYSSTQFYYSYFDYDYCVTNDYIPIPLFTISDNTYSTFNSRVPLHTTYRAISYNFKYTNTTTSFIGVWGYVSKTALVDDGELWFKEIIFQRTLNMKGTIEYNLSCISNTGLSTYYSGTDTFNYRTDTQYSHILLNDPLYISGNHYSFMQFKYFDMNTLYQDGYTDGYDDGIKQNNDTAYNTGYATGYTDGERSGKSFITLFGAIADTPLLMIRSLFDFELFGLRMYTAVLGLITALILVFIIRKLV